MHEPEAAADDEGAAEQRLHLLGPGVGGDVEILGLDAEQQVAHGAADDEGLEAGLVQLARHLERAARQLLAADRMVARAVDAGLPCRALLAGKQAGEQAADHRGIRVARPTGSDEETDGWGGRRRKAHREQWSGRATIIARGASRDPAQVARAALADAHPASAGALAAAAHCSAPDASCRVVAGFTGIQDN